MLAMSNFLLVPHAKLEPAHSAFTLILKFGSSHPTAAEPHYLLSFPCLKDKRRGKTSYRTIELAQPSPESNPHFWPPEKQGISLKLSSIFLNLCVEKCFRRNSSTSFSILHGAAVFNL